MKNLSLTNSEINKGNCIYGSPTPLSSIYNNRDDDASRQFEATFKYMDGMISGKIYILTKYGTIKLLLLLLFLVFLSQVKSIKLLLFSNNFY